MDNIINLRLIDDIPKSKVQLPRLAPRVIGILQDDTGESGETYDAEAKAEAWARIITTQ